MNPFSHRLLFTKGILATAPASWSAVAEMRGRSLASATPLSGVSRHSITHPTLDSGVAPRLADAVASIWMRLACLVMSLLLMTSCLDFGAENEFFAPSVTAEHLKTIETRTGIDLPKGSIGMAFYSNATGIDPWMLSKVKIPSDQVAAFLASDSMQKPKPDHPTSSSGSTRDWWKPEDLQHSTKGEFSHNHSIVIWTIGQEGTDHVLYIKWLTF